MRAAPPATPQKLRCAVPTILVEAAMELLRRHAVFSAGWNFDGSRSFGDRLGDFTPER
jgi:hypothetical protein